MQIPKSEKALQRYLGYVKYYKIYIPRMAERLSPSYKMLKTEAPINITSELKNTFVSVKRLLSDAWGMALKQPIPGKQPVLMTDASFTSAGYALMIEDNPDQKIQSQLKTYAPVAFGFKIFSPPQLKLSIYSEDFLTIYIALLEFVHILWEPIKPTFILTDNKSVTRFFQTKSIPPALWNARNYVLQFNFNLAHIAGSINTAAEYLSRLEFKVTEKYVSKSEKTFKQHLLRWQHLLRMLLMKNGSSLPRQTMRVSQKNKASNGKINLGQTQENG